MDDESNIEWRLTRIAKALERIAYALEKINGDNVERHIPDVNVGNMSGDCL